MKYKKIIALFLASLAINSHAEMLVLSYPLEHFAGEFFADNFSMSFEGCICEVEGASAGPMATKSGFKMSHIEPVAMIDIVPKPGDFASLDMQFDFADEPLKGTCAADNSQSTDGTYTSDGGCRYTHVIGYPMFGLLNFIQDFLCFDRADTLFMLQFTDLPISTEKNDILSSFLHFDRVLAFSNPIAQMFGSLAAPTVALTKTGSDMYGDVVGGWGQLGTCNIRTEGGNVMTEGGLLSACAVDKMMLEYLFTKTANVSKVVNYSAGLLRDSMCQERYFPQLLQQQYWIQLIYPNNWDPIPLGYPGFLWENFKNMQWANNRAVYVLWKKRDYCGMGAYKCTSMFDGLGQ